jgi:hypothetical protein
LTPPFRNGTATSLRANTPLPSICGSTCP